MSHCVIHAWIFHTSIHHLSTESFSFEGGPHTEKFHEFVSSQNRFPFTLLENQFQMKSLKIYFPESTQSMKSLSVAESASKSVEFLCVLSWKRKQLSWNKSNRARSCPDWSSQLNKRRDEADVGESCWKSRYDMIDWEKISSRAITLISPLAIARIPMKPFQTSEKSIVSSIKLSWMHYFCFSCQ